jgi:NNP family nitrate/nitrite transporter-like MFS transporter
MAGFLFKSEALSWPQALLILGVLVMICAGFTALVRFSEADERAAKEDMEARLATAEPAMSLA